MRLATTQVHRALSPPHRAARAFTIVELLVTLTIIALLTSIMMPGLRAARDSANRMVCSANLRHIGLALYGYSAQLNDALPATMFDEEETLASGEMMALTTGTMDLADFVPQWDGLGWLVAPETGLIDDPHMLYCPCHRGEHPASRYEDKWDAASPERVYCNYHFIGDFDREQQSARRLLLMDGDSAIVVDGMRTSADINHRNGTNMLRADLAVRFWHDRQFRLRELVNAVDENTAAPDDAYRELWKLFGKDE